MFEGLHHQVRRAYYQAGMLYELHLDLLYQCDLDCEHCYLDDKSKQVLSTEFWRDVIDQAADMRVFTMTISGGEFFLRKDALELLTYARERGIFLHLKSHGGHIDAAMALAIAKIGVTSVWISYYSHDPATHDAITRREGSHAATLAAMTVLREHNVNVVAACSVMKRNRDHIGALTAQCDALGIGVRLDGEIRAAHSGDAFPTDTALGLDDMVALETLKLDREGGCEVPSASNDWGEKKNCVAGVMALYISPEGDVTPCVTWPMPLGNLNRGDRLDAIWAGSSRLRGIKDHRQADREVCTRCAVRDECDFCMGQSWVDHRDETVPVSLVCTTTRAKSLARARALGLPDPPMPAGLVETPPARPTFRILSDAERASG